MPEPRRMSPRARVAAAVRGEPVDQIPFLVYDALDKDGGERLRELGCTNWGMVEVVTSVTPNVVTEHVEYEERGARYRRTTQRTPAGEVHATWRLDAAYGTDWYVDHYIKGPDDYKVVEYMVRDMVFQPVYEGFDALLDALGEEGYATTWFMYSPLMEMEVNLMGLERFSQDLLDRPDLFFSLYETLRVKHREAYPLLANSPAEYIRYCGNCVPEVLGRNFERYCIPCYDELGEMLHEKGKLLACHLDASNAFWSEAVGRSQIDVIEAFTPAPDSDMTTADARAAWPDKALVLNFPSSVHLAPIPRVKATARQIVAEAAPGRGLVMAITEDVPEHLGNTTLIAIAEVLAEEVGHKGDPASAGIS